MLMPSIHPSSYSSSRTWWCLLWISFAAVNAQEAPSIFANKFDKSVSYRTNVCDRQRALWNGTMNLPDALAGLNLTVVVPSWRKPDKDMFFRTINGRIDHHDPGLFVVIMDEVARRAQFQWRNTYGVAASLTPETDGNKTWSDILKWGVETFDVSLEVWGYSLERSRMGISFPTGFWDSSIVLAEHVDKSQKRRDVNLWSFLQPFTPGVWALIVVAIIFTGSLCWYLQYIDAHVDQGIRIREMRPSASAITTAALLFTQQFAFEPTTGEAQVVTLSFSFWSLIVTSAYVANIFSFLSTPFTQVFQFPDIQTALEKDAVVCVLDSAVINDYFTEKYPEIKVMGKTDEAEIFTSLRLKPADGGCNVAAHQYNSFRIFQRHRDVNYDCSLKTAGNVVEVISAGMATLIDAGGDGSEHSKCTSIISHVLDYHLLQMRADGFIDQAWATHLDKVGSFECVDGMSTSGGGDDGSEETFSLGIHDMGGIFILHACAAVLSVLMALYEYHKRPPELRKTLSSIFGIDKVVHVSREFERRLSTPRSLSRMRNANACSQEASNNAIREESPHVNRETSFASSDASSFGLTMDFDGKLSLGPNQNFARSTSMNRAVDDHGKEDVTRAVSSAMERSVDQRGKEQSDAPDASHWFK